MTAPTFISTTFARINTTATIPILYNTTTTTNASTMITSANSSPTFAQFNTTATTLTANATTMITPSNSPQTLYNTTESPQTLYNTTANSTTLTTSLLSSTTFILLNTTATTQTPADSITTIMTTPTNTFTTVPSNTTVTTQALNDSSASATTVITPTNFSTIQTPSNTTMNETTTAPANFTTTFSALNITDTSRVSNTTIYATTQSSNVTTDVMSTSTNATTTFAPFNVTMTAQTFISTLNATTATMETNISTTAAQTNTTVTTIASLNTTNSLTSMTSLSNSSANVTTTLAPDNITVSSQITTQPSFNTTPNATTEIATPTNSSFTDVSINTTTISTTESTTTAPTTTTLPPLIVNLTVNAVAVIGNSFAFQCTVKNAQTLQELEFSRDGQVFAVLNTSSSLVTVTQSDVTVKGQYESDTYRAEVTLVPITCSDSGKYECVAKGIGSAARDSADLQVTRHPDSLTLEVPLSAEGVTQTNPVCRATSQGYNPVMAFTWVLRRPNGTEERLSHSLQTDDTKTNTSSCSSSGSSTLNAQRYTGWNNTDLCCQLTDPTNNSLVAKEICQKIQTLPGDYCSTGNSSFLIYPFESCYTYIQCVGPTIYFSFCSKTLGLCFDIRTISCSLSPATTSTTYDPFRTTQTTITTTRNPFICSLGGPEYLPNNDTFPNKCNTFQWCVNGISYLQTCQGQGNEFIYEKPGDNTCAAPSNTTYCGKLRLLVTTQPATTSTIFSSIQASTSTFTTNATVLATQSAPTTPISTNFTESSLSPNAQTSTLIISNASELMTSNVSSTTSAPNATSDTESTTTTPTTTTLPSIVVNLTINDVAVIGESFTFQCTVRNVQSLYEIEFLRNGQTLAILNISSSLVIVTQPSMSVKGQYDSDTYKSEVTLNPVACSDFGNYECIARGTSSLGRQTALLQVRRHPDSLTLEVPLSVEGVTQSNPVCHATSQGYNPVMAFTWVLKRPNGVVERLSKSLQTDDVKTNTSSCTNNGTSTLNAQRYTGWNNTDLCCQLTDPNNSSLVVKEICQKIQTLPGDYCSTGNRSFLIYPFESCYTYVSCSGQYIYFAYCPKERALCFDVTSVSCSLPPATTSTTYDPSRTTQTTIPTTRNPFICSLGGPEYLPYNDTYPNKCNTFQWCVNGLPILQTCQGQGNEFIYEKPGDNTCAAPSNTTYCGKLRLLVTTQPVDPTGTTVSTAAPSTTTQNPFSCTGNSLTYIPTINTYPNHCGEYRWCYGSGEVLQTCTVGSEFAYGSTPCIYRHQGDTYCEQREAAAAGN